MLNRKAAARFRQRRKQEIDKLQNSNQSLRNEIERMKCVIIRLKRQIHMGGFDSL
jgi:DNA anti-recombination protein RmuC